jgi:hypothetical protein
MKNHTSYLLLFSVFMSSCTKEVFTAMENHDEPFKIVKTANTRIGAGDVPDIRFDFNIPVTSNIWLNSGNMTNTNISPIDTLCCDGIPTQEFSYHYGSLNNGFYFVEAYADTLLDYNMEFANIDVSGYSFLNPCPQGMNVSYVGPNCITNGVITWGNQQILLKGCHYVSVKLRIYPNVADTVYIQIFRGQPVVSNSIKSWQ